jgi:4-hydroxy-2-oxoheptanedioate aldolase
MAITINFLHDGLAEFLGRLGYDMIVADGEHGRVDDSEIERFARACEIAGAAPIVRVPVNGPIMERYLSMGVYGFHVPRIRNLDEARELIDAVKFPPLGKRGLGNFRAIDYGLSLGAWPDYIQRANDNTFIKAAVEDPEGLEALPEIVKLPEIDVFFVGRYDLSASLGVPGEINHPKVVETYNKAIAVIKGAGKAFGMGVRTVEGLKNAHASGARYFLSAVSRTFVAGSTELMGAFRGL